MDILIIILTILSAILAFISGVCMINDFLYLKNSYWGVFLALFMFCGLLTIKGVVLYNKLY